MVSSQRSCSYNKMASTSTLETYSFAFIQCISNYLIITKATGGKIITGICGKKMLSSIICKLKKWG